MPEEEDEQDALLFDQQVDRTYVKESVPLHSGNNLNKLIVLFHPECEHDEQELSSFLDEENNDVFRFHHTVYTVFSFKKKDIGQIHEETYFTCTDWSNRRLLDPNCLAKSIDE